MTARIDERQYAELLSLALPQVIKTKEENEKALERTSELMKKGDERSSAEEALLELLVALVEKFEAEHYEIPKAVPHEILEFMLEQRGLRPVDLLPVFGSRGYVSDILSGRRKITAEKAREFGVFFNLDPGQFV
jgi:HTH-type transcriptional regulator/antitoxin HigA